MTDAEIKKIVDGKTFDWATYLKNEDLKPATAKTVVDNWKEFNKAYNDYKGAGTMSNLIPLRVATISFMASCNKLSTHKDLKGSTMEFVRKGFIKLEKEIRTDVFAHISSGDDDDVAKIPGFKAPKEKPQRAAPSAPGPARPTSAVPKPPSSATTTTTTTTAAPSTGARKPKVVWQDLPPKGKK